MRDLRPYICTYRDCKDVDQQYDSFKHWCDHENNHHRIVRRCTEHPEDVFKSMESWREHIGTYHLQTSVATPIEVIETAFASNDSERACPICNQDAVSNEHVGNHLQQIALFALPKSTGLEDDLDLHEDSSAATAEDLNEDRDADLGSLDFSGGEDRPPDAVYGVDYNNVGNMLADLDPYQLAPDKRVLLEDWTAVFNPNSSRPLNVGSVHSISHTSVVCCVRFSTYGTVIAVGLNHSATVYSVTTGQEVVSFEHQDPSLLVDYDMYVRDVCFDSKDVYLATGAEDRKIRVKFLSLTY